jgi:heptosyltransferase-2
MPDASYSNILVFQTAFLGDVVLTTPLFRALKRLYPLARLTLLTTPQARPLVEEDPHLDAILTYDKKGGERMREVIGKIRARGFDVLISPHRSHRTALIALFSGIPVRVGYAESGFAFAYNRHVRRPMDLHEVDRVLALVRGLGAEPDAADRVLFTGYTELEKNAVDAVLSEAGVSAGEKIAGLCPGSVWATKRWTPEGFAYVGRALTARGFRVVCIGGPEERDTAAAVAHRIGPRAVNAAGRTPLKALAAWMDRFSVFVTNDSAPLHVAAARNVPTVAVFGATTRNLGFSPFHEKSRVVEADLPCRPCGPHGGRSCPEGHFRCMRDIDPQRVVDACLDLLATQGVRP